MVVLERHDITWSEVLLDTEAWLEHDIITLGLGYVDDLGRVKVDPLTVWEEDADDLIFFGLIDEGLENR